MALITREEFNQETKFIVYTRVSTDKQGQDGYGMEAQLVLVESVLGSLASNIIAPTFVEVESGKNNERKEFEKAKARAKKEKAVLVVAKLDRLSRDVGFIDSLIKDKSVDIFIAEYPNADKAMIQMLAVFAEMEADRISQRTKASLKVAKSRGKKLGASNGKIKKALKASNEKRKATRNKIADEHASNLKAILEGFIASKKTRRQMIEELNKLGVKTVTGKSTWHLPTLQRTLVRLGLV